MKKKSHDNYQISSLILGMEKPAGHKRKELNKKLNQAWYDWFGDIIPRFNETVKKIIHRFNDFVESCVNHLSFFSKKLKKLITNLILILFALFFIGSIAYYTFLSIKGIWLFDAIVPPQRIALMLLNPFMYILIYILYLAYISLQD